MLKSPISERYCHELTDILHNISEMEMEMEVKTERWRFISTNY